MKIGEVAKKAEVNIETIRYYERKGIINRPEKPARGYRDYAEDVVAVLKFIKNAQKLGFSLSEIDGLLSLKFDPEKDCSLVKTRALDKITEIENKIYALQIMKQSLQEITNKCNGLGTTSTCNILNALDSEELI